MSFGFGVGDFLAVLKLANGLRKDFVAAPTQLRSIHTELKGLTSVLNDVEDILSQENLTKSQEAEICDISKGCHELLNEITALVAKNSAIAAVPASTSKVRRTWQRFNWDEDEIKDLRSRLIANTSLLNAFTSSLTSEAVFETRDGVQKMNNSHDEMMRLEVIDWYSKTDYLLQQLDFRSTRADGTGDWVIQSPEFQHWLMNRGQTLFCPGIPGGGKTMIASTVIDFLQARFAGDDKVGVAFLYCNFRRKADQMARDLVSSLLRELLLQLTPLPAKVVELRGACLKDHRLPTMVEIVACLSAALESFPHGSYLIVDALDESQVSRDGRDTFLTELFALQTATHVNIFATSRHIPDIEERFKDATKLEIRGRDEDIRYFLASSMSELRGALQRNAALQAEVIDTIAKAVDGMFLLARLYMQSLQGKTTAKAIKVALAKLPRVASGKTESNASMPLAREAYDLAYDEAMERINSQYADSRDLALQVLGWINRAARPLKTAELQHGLAVELDENAFDDQNIPAIEDIQSVCAGLIMIDEQSDIIRLVHYTTQEYFERTWTQWFPDADKKIAKTCIHYLSLFSGARDWRMDDSSWQLRHFGNYRLRTDHALQNILDLCLYEYAFRYWGRHCRGQQKELASDILEFLKAHPGVRSKPRPSAEDSRSFSLNDPPVCDPVCLTAAFGLAIIVTEFLNRGFSVDLKDSQVAGPLHWAVAGDHLETVSVLVNAGAGPNRHFRGRRSLSIAIEKESGPMITLLLEKGANPSLKSNGLTPLATALILRSAAGVKLLLELYYCPAGSITKPKLRLIISDHSDPIPFSLDDFYELCHEILDLAPELREREGQAVFLGIREVLQRLGVNFQDPSLSKIIEDPVSVYPSFGAMLPQRAIAMLPAFRGSTP